MLEEEQSTDKQLFAAIDLGSNSFHLIIAEKKNNQLLILDRLKEMVRLASGLNKKGELTPESQQSAIECLSRFGQLLKNVPAENIRIVGTNTLRKAKNSSQFIQLAEQALEHEIEVIAGREEARLIYLGVAHGQAENQSNRLVVDIGGGSTEFIIGKGFNPLLTESLHMGCVSMTLKAFADEKLNESNFNYAETLAELELQTIKKTYLKTGWSFATGSSGTIKAIGNVLYEYYGNDYQGITAAGLAWIKSQMMQQKSISRLSLEGLSKERTPVFVGGVVILSAAFKVLQIESMDVSDSALREGVIYDLQGRVNHEDVRDRTIKHLLSQYHIDSKQAKRVKKTALKLFKQVHNDWDINLFESHQTLEWATMLHEIGLSIAHNQYHKHGAYIIQNSDLPGFSQQEQKRLALLIRAQRRKFPKQEFKALNQSCSKSLLHLAIILRLAILIRRDRQSLKLPSIAVKASKKHLSITIPEKFLTAHPLTYADLKFEAEYLKAIKFKLLINETNGLEHGIK